MRDSQTPLLDGDETLLPGGLESDGAPIPRRPSDVAGVVLGRYRIERELGRGASGVVFLARDPELDRNVALKVLRPHVGASGKGRERFFREARVLAGLVDPGLATVFDVGSAPLAGVFDLGERDDEVFYIVMEYVAGTDLAKWLAAQRRPWREVVRVFSLAGRGLMAAHRRGVVHRDFKPGNVLMSTDGAVKVADFGLARGLTMPSDEPSRPDPPGAEQPLDSASAALTRTGGTVGTPMFMAPEQHEGKHVGPRADQYAFCVALFHAFVGEYPFMAGTLAGLWREKAKGAPTAWPPGTEVPRWVRAVVDRGLQARPADRFSSMSDLLSRLEKSPQRRVVQASSWLLVPVALAWGGTASYEATRPCTVHLDVRSSTGEPLADLEVRVDGDVASVDGERLGVQSGRHLIEVHAAQHEVAARTVDARAGGDIQLDVVLPRQVGTVDVSAHPGAARIFIDGVDHGSRVRDLPIPTGEHAFEVRLDGHFSRRFRWSIAKSEHRATVVTLPEVFSWEHPFPQPSSIIEWLPDMTGDGRNELMLARAGVATILDPWSDTTVSSIRYGHSFVTAQGLVELDGDDVPELVTLAATEHERTLAVHDLGDPERPRWTTTLRGHAEVIAHLVVLDRAEPPVIVVLDQDTLRAFAATTGEPQWELESPGAQKLLPLDVDAVVVQADTGGMVVSAGGESRWSTADGSLVPGRDLDGDGRRELVQTRPESPFAVLDGATGRARWHGPAGATGVLRTQDARSGAPVIAIDEAGALVLDSVTGEVRHRMVGTRPQVYPLGSQTLVSTIVDEQVVFYDTATGRETGRVLLEHARLRSAGDFNGDGVPELVWAGTQGTLEFRTAQLEPLAFLALEKPATRLVSTTDGDHDGVHDLLFENRRGLLLLQGPKRQWTVRSQHSMRAPPLIYDGPEGAEVLATLERAGTRNLARVDGVTGEASLTPLQVGSDLHREAGRSGDGLYFSASGRVLRHRISDGEMTADQTLGGLIYATPTVLDVDGDGDREVLVGTFGRVDPELVVLSESVETIQRRVALPEHTWSRVVPYEVDGSLLVLVFGLQGAVTALEPAADWAVRWQAAAGARINFAGVVVETSNGPRIAVTTMAEAPEDDALVWFDARDGTRISEHRGWGARGSTPHASDVDRNGRVDVFVADNAGQVRRFEDGALVWTRSVMSGSDADRRRSASSPLASGRTKPAEPAVLVTTWRDGSVVVVGAQEGETQWRTSVGARIEGRPLLGDVDGDGEAEVVVATHDGALICLRNGAPRWVELSGASDR